MRFLPFLYLCVGLLAIWISAWHGQRQAKRWQQHEQIIRRAMWREPSRKDAA